MSKTSQTKNIALASVASMIKTLCQFLQVALLVRFFLDSADFGLLAIATFIISFSDLFLDMGLTVFIMYKQKISVEQFSSLYWFNLLLSIVLVLLLTALSPFVSEFYKEEQLQALIPLLSFNLLFWAIGRNYRTLLEKDFQFKPLAVIDTFVALFIFCTALLLAWFNFGVWSVVIANVVGVLFQNMAYLYKGYPSMPLKMVIRVEDIKEFLAIGLYQFGAKLLDFFSAQSDVLIIGKLLGMEVLGMYNIIRQIVFSLGGFINNGFNAVMPPIFVKMQQAETDLRETFLKFMGMIILINTLFFGILAFSSETALWIVYGERYLESGFILTCLACMYSLNTIGNPVYALIVSKGRTDIAMYWTIYRLIVSIAAITLAAAFSIEAVAFALFGVALFNIYPYYRFVYRQLQEIPSVAYFRVIRPVILLSLVLVGGKYFIRFQGHPIDFIYIILFALLLLCYLWFDNKELKRILQDLFKKVGVNLRIRL